MSKKDKTIIELQKTVAAFAAGTNALIIKLGQEAFSRKKWKDNIVFILLGAAGEFFKCRINDKLNSGMKDRDHWEKEWRRHLYPNLLHSMRTEKHFQDTEKAVQEAIDAYKKRSHTDMTFAANTMADYLNQSSSKMRKVLSNEDLNDFYQEIDRAVEAHFKTMETDRFNPKIENVFRVINEVPEKDWNNKTKKRKKK